ncbi:MAG: hypothetical protein IT350_06150 [Deltaproteobacteria bacterium]|nr:hypothetical protein [Deltaproteobacteria bacterium]
MSWKRISVLAFVLGFTFCFAAVAAAGDYSMAPDKNPQLKRSSYGMLVDAVGMEEAAYDRFITPAPGWDPNPGDLDGSEDITIGGVTFKSGFWFKKASALLDYAWSQWQAGRYYKAAYAAQAAETIFVGIVEYEKL